ncbi:hypothetical protein J4474_04680 [Candidatus Pacearchaeota archaeon]|nr:hypothetical protein [Candidatus Pacearchaeota archaeon]
MNLGKKKQLAARTLGVGKSRVHFVNENLNEIKEAITKQDIRDLVSSGAIKVKEVKGRRKVLRKSKKITAGNVRVKVNKRKRDYIALTRKLRKNIAELKKQGKIDAEGYKDLRKRVRNKEFKSKSHMKTFVEENKK